MATPLEFSCTFRRPIRINHCTCWNTICPSLKCHRSSSLCDRVRFWLASLVTHTASANVSISLSIWLGIIYSWIGKFSLGHTWRKPSQQVRPSANLAFPSSNETPYNYHDHHDNEIWRYPCNLLMCKRIVGKWCKNPLVTQEHIMNDIGGKLYVHFHYL